MIETAGLTKYFDKTAALSGVTCHIPKGCIYGMVGSNGAGKSTFLRLLSGIYRADGGTVKIDGEDVFNNPAVKQQTVFVPDELYFLPGSSMSRMASLYAAAYPTFDHDRFRQLTEKFRLDPTKPINTFSKGMRRQAATVLALAVRPLYLFFDETFDGLDPVMRGLVKSLICEDVADRRTTAIITSHSLRELEDTCDQLALLHKGGLVMESDVTNLKTSLFKIQIAFADHYTRERFEGIDMLHFSKHGSVSNLIVRGDREETARRLQALAPILLDILPLSLEEVFTYEMEALGYSFDKEETV